MSRRSDSMTIRQYNPNVKQSSSYTLTAIYGQSGFMIFARINLQVTHKRNCQCSDCWNLDKKRSRTVRFSGHIGSMDEEAVAAGTRWFAEFARAHGETDLGYPAEGDRNKLVFKLSEKNAQKMRRWLKGYSKRALKRERQELQEKANELRAKQKAITANLRAIERKL
jgi:hypothetical protein